jgi:hypothetical protein
MGRDEPGHDPPPADADLIADATGLHC